MPRIQDIGAFNTVREAGLAKLVPAAPRLTVGMGTCGQGNGAEGLYQAFAQAIERGGADIVLAPVGCFGACFQEPLVSVRLPGKPLVILRKVQANDAARTPPFSGRAPRHARGIIGLHFAQNDQRFSRQTHADQRLLKARAKTADRRQHDVGSAALNGLGKRLVETLGSVPLSACAHSHGQARCCRH